MTSQGRTADQLVDFILGSGAPWLFTDPLFSLNKSPAVYILLRALDGFWTASATG